MAGELIRITIDDNTGESSVDLQGFHGKGCAAVIKAFGEIGEITSEIHKPEFNQVQTQKVAQGQ